MKQEDKDLLLRYLSMALPYELKLQYQGKDYDYLGIDRGRIFVNIARIGEWLSCINTYEVKPYLHPMSSMTDEEKKEFDEFCVINEFAWKGNSEIGYKNQAIIMSNAINWLLKKHFDIFGLIPKGLAIAVTKENNTYNITEE